MAVTEYFCIVDRNGETVHPRVSWETISELLELMMVQRHKRRDHCFFVITSTPEQLAQVRATIKKRVNGSVIAECNRTIVKKHFANDAYAGWYYEHAEAENWPPKAA